MEKDFLEKPGILEKPGFFPETLVLWDKPRAKS